MKKKIMFYGNCQLGVLSKMLEINTPRFNEQYEILKAADYDLATIWNKESGVVSPFMYVSTTEYGFATDNTIKSLERIIDEADIIVFQNFNMSADRRIELTTDYIYDKYHTNKQMICIPSFWFSGYLSENNKNNLQMPYIFLWLLEKGLNNAQILDWLKNENDPKIANLIDYNVNNCLEELKQREVDERSKYKCFISIDDILNQYKENIICYNMSHPNEYYFKMLYEKLINVLDKNLYYNINEDDMDLPGPDFSPFPLDLCWFRENFKNLNVSRKKYTTFIDIDFVNTQIESLKTLTDKDLQILQPKLNLLRE
jgi:hypothetical protein